MRIIDEVIEQFSRLPGIGKKSATRLAYFLLSKDKSFTTSFANSLLQLHENIKLCPICGCFTEGDYCEYCDDASRDKSTICVVEKQQELLVFRELSEYKGLFHVLGGVISPLDGIGPEDLAIPSLVKRIEQGNVQEVILAMNLTVEGDTTALYLQRLLKAYPISVTRLAAGIPVGGDLEYADKLTLLRSLNGRMKV